VPPAKGGGMEIKMNSEKNTFRSLGIIYKEESKKGLTHPFFSLVLDSFKAEAEALGYSICFINLLNISDDINWNDFCRNSMIEGLCIVCADFGAENIKTVSESSVPCVTVDHIYKHVPAVLSDNETGMTRLVEYAIGMGHKKIAFVHGHNNSLVTRTRIMQFQNVMGYHDLPIPPEYMREGLYDDVALTRRIVKELLSLKDRPTCILLPDDTSYFGAQDAAREMGLSIPDDISFAGYDGIPITQSLLPKLTTIRQNSETIGSTAARKLIDLIENPKTARRMPVIYPVELIEGGTVGRVD